MESFIYKEEKSGFKKSIEGRVGRIEFLLGSIFVLLYPPVYIYSLWILPEIAIEFRDLLAIIIGWISFLVILFGALFLFYLILMYIRMGIRRLHDIGLSGWFIIILLPLIYNIFLSYESLLYSAPPTPMDQTQSNEIFYYLIIVYYLFLLLYPGSKVQNKYGNPQPKRSFWGSMLKREVSLPKEEQTIIDTHQER